MRSHAEYRLQLAEQRRADERRDASHYRLNAGLPPRATARPIRSSIGRSLIRLGQRLDEGNERSLEPAGPR